MRRDSSSSRLGTTRSSHAPTNSRKAWSPRSITISRKTVGFWFVAHAAASAGLLLLAATGDVAVAGSDSNWSEQLLWWAECEPLLEGFCAEAGLSDNAAVFYRPSPEIRYEHIESLFGDPGRNAIDWQLIEKHWTDLMQVALSIREGKLSSVLLLRRLGTNSRKNNIYKAFRELGRAVRTIALLRFISDPELRQQVTAAINKVEAFNGYSAWLRFGGEAIERNDPAEQEKTLKFNSGLGPANAARAELPTIAPRALDKRAAVRFLRAVESCHSPRDRALTLTPLYAGTRIAETVALDIDDIRLSARKGILRVYGKGEKVREIPLHAKHRDALTDPVLNP